MSSDEDLSSDTIEFLSNPFLPLYFGTAIDALFLLEASLQYQFLTMKHMINTANNYCLKWAPKYLLIVTIVNRLLFHWFGFSLPKENVFALSAALKIAILQTHLFSLVFCLLIASLRTIHAISKEFNVFIINCSIFIRFFIILECTL